VPTPDAEVIIGHGFVSIARGATQMPPAMLKPFSLTVATKDNVIKPGAPIHVAVARPPSHRRPRF
jgi:hypothetical protein